MKNNIFKFYYININKYFYEKIINDIKFSSN